MISIHNILSIESTLPQLESCTPIQSINCNIQISLLSIDKVNIFFLLFIYLLFLMFFFFFSFCRSMNRPRRGPSLLPPPAQATSPPPLQPSCRHPQKTRPPVPYPLPRPQSTTRPATARLHQILTNGTFKTLKRNNKKSLTETKQNKTN